MDVPADLRYTDDHEWVRLDGDTGIVGITAYAADQLCDIVFVELPAVGTSLASRQSFGVVESVKAVSDLYSPVSGEVIEANESLSGNPEVLNTDPYGEGWILKLRVNDSAEVDALRDADSYRQLTEAG